MDETASDLDAALARLERASAQRKALDWDTLFRQLADAMTRLCEHPFIRGDMEAELRLEAVLRASDLEMMDQRMDHLVSYVTGKIAFTLAARGEDAGAEMRPIHSGPPDGTNTRRVAAGGPSGDDFNLSEAEDAPPLRGVLRL